METLRTGPLPAEIVKQLGPLHSLQAVEDLLKANRIAFAWGRGQVSSGTLPAAFVKEIEALPPHEVFFAPQGDKGVVIGVVMDRVAYTRKPCPGFRTSKYSRAAWDIVSWAVEPWRPDRLPSGDAAWRRGGHRPAPAYADPALLRRPGRLRRARAGRRPVAAGLSRRMTQAPFRDPSFLKLAPA